MLQKLFAVVCASLCGRSVRRTRRPARHLGFEGLGGRLMCAGDLVLPPDIHVIPVAAEVSSSGFLESVTFRVEGGPARVELHISADGRVEDGWAVIDQSSVVPPTDSSRRSPNSRVPEDSYIITKTVTIPQAADFVVNIAGDGARLLTFSVDLVGYPTTPVHWQDDNAAVAVGTSGINWFSIESFLQDVKTEIGVGARPIATDVTADGHTSGLDALTVINRLNSPIPAPEGAGRWFLDPLDVTRDGIVSGLDALHIINVLNERSGTVADTTTTANVVFVSDSSESADETTTVDNVTAVDAVFAVPAAPVVRSAETVVDDLFPSGTRRTEKVVDELFAGLETGELTLVL